MTSPLAPRKPPRGVKYGRDTVSWHFYTENLFNCILSTVNNLLITYRKKWVLILKSFFFLNNLLKFHAFSEWKWITS